LTEVAPHTGRRAIREAEARLRKGHGQAGSGYWRDMAPGGTASPHPPGAHASLLPADAVHAASPAPNGQAIHRPPAGYATPPPAGYATPPPAGYATPPTAGHASLPPTGYASAPTGHATPPRAARRGGPPPSVQSRPAIAIDDPADGALRGRHATGWNQGFDRVVIWTLLGSLLPGTGLIAAGRRWIGGLILGGCLLTAAGVSALLLFGDPVALISRQLLAHPERLTYAAVALVVLGVLWALQVIGTHVSLRRFAELTSPQRVLALLLVTALAIGGVGGTIFGGKQVILGRDTLMSIFAGDQPLSAAAKRPDMSGNGADPWVNIPRMNVLMIGSDAGADRTGLRTDSLMVASINTHTGDTVLFGIPRNLEHAPFPAGTKQAADYPNGFVCPQHACLINALWQFGVDHANSYYQGQPNPGLTATVQGVQGTLGLSIDSYAMLDLRGFMAFVNAVGGVTINVTRKIPVGGHLNPATGVATGVTSYLQPGRQLLNGYQALWFARSRSDSDDYERMRRQRCVIGAITQQTDPQTVALHLPAILQAAKDNIRTNIPLSDIDAWVTLTLRIKKAHVRSLPFTNAVIDSGNPDFDKIHQLVQQAITPAAAARATTAATPTPQSATPTPTASATGNGASTSTPSTAGKVVDPTKAIDVNAVC
jgi:polyisoprenyl-teichoic acid--peptidoglycan teichoic acid transferase